MKSAKRVHFIMPSNLTSSQTRTTKHYSRTRNAVSSQLSVPHSPGISAVFQMYSVIKLYMFRASSLPIIRSFLLYIRH